MTLNIRTLLAHFQVFHNLEQILRVVIVNNGKSIEDSVRIHLPVILAHHRRYSDYITAIFIFLTLVSVASHIGCSPAVDRSTAKTAEMIEQAIGEPQVDSLQICDCQPSAVSSMVFADDRHIYAGFCSGVVKIFDIQAYKKEIRSSKISNCIAQMIYLSSTRQLIFAYTSTLHSIDCADFSNISPYYRASQYDFLCFSDGTAILTHRDEGILLVDVSSRQVRKILPPDGDLNGINTAIYSSKGDILVAGGAAGVLRRWDLDGKGGTVRFDCQIGSPIYSLAFSPDGDNIAVASMGKAIQLLDANKGSCVKELKVNTSHMESHFLIYKNRDTLISIEPVGDNCQPGLIRFWNVKSGFEMHSPVVGHKWRIASCCLSPDHSLLATGGLDGSIIVWRISDR